MKREGNHLVPTDAVAAEMLAEVPAGTGVMVTVKVPRNLRQFRLAWALADIISKSVDFLHDREDAMTWLKIKSRHVRMIHDPLRGTTAIVPKSIAFASLDQVGFARLLSRMIYVTTTEIIPGLEAGALRAELESIVGIDTEPAHAPEPAKPPRPTRARKTNPEPVSQAEGGGGTSAPPEIASNNAAQSPAGRPAPSNEAEYLSAARSWIGKQTDHAKALEYLDSAPQIELRAACNLSIGANKLIRRELATHIENLSKGKTDASTTN
jgi:hypothetical protein